MSTPSTKSSGSKKKKPAVEQKAVPAGAPELPARIWWIGVLVILVVAAALRFYDLNLVPLHHDEGVNGNFLVRLVREGEYRYDPQNYHGPTLYYFAAVIPWITRLLFGTAARDNYGMTTFTIRLIPVLFGLGTIGLIFCLRRRLGSVGTLAAGLLLAISPGAVYLSRYFIHESQFVFFTLGIVVAGLRFYDTRNPLYLGLASASAALLFATKETAMISAGVLVIAFGVTHIYRWLYRAVFLPRRSGKGRRYVPEQSAFAVFLKDLGGWIPLVICVVIGLVIFVLINIIFYSSFFTNAQGISDSLKTFEVWSKTSQTAHVYPAYRYIEWLLSQEGSLLFLGLIGAATAVLKPKNSFALFSALWAFGLIAAYSLIPYKTPWLMLNFLVPLALIAGYLAQFIYEMDRGHVRVVAAIWLLPVCLSAYQMIDLNFINYDNDKPYYVYVYAHTTRGMLDLVKEIDQIAAKEDGPKTGISILSPDYWPLPWYLRNYSRVGYYGRTAATSEPLIIANEKQKAEIDTNYGAVYQQVRSSAPDGSFELRPGVRLLLYQHR
ncbi:MAG TPA: flippase activity-associated protein Agl23 [Pyrinomonadaceae bacterium]|nr:flippase activity-associated protein Agl23 [Pyrinomonadaceae bacterium]